MKKYTLDRVELKKWTKNILMFTAPAFVVFFYQLSTGVTFKEALPLAMFALYGLLADYFKKLK